MSDTGRGKRERERENGRQTERTRRVSRERVG